MEFGTDIFIFADGRVLLCILPRVVVALGVQGKPDAVLPAPDMLHNIDLTAVRPRIPAL